MKPRFSLKVPSKLTDQLQILADQLPLTGYQIYAGDDLDVASRAISRIPGRRQLIGRGYVQVNRAVLSMSHLVQTYNEEPTILNIVGPSEHISVVIPMQGALTMKTAGTSIDVEPGSACVFPIGIGIETHKTANSLVIITSLTAEGYETVFGDISSIGTSALPARIDISDKKYGSFLSLLGTLCRELNEESHKFGRQNDVIRHLEMAMWKRFIDLVPALEPEPRAPFSKGKGEIPANIARVIDAIEVHTEEDLRLRDLVRFANMSVRSLQMGFSSATGVTPMAYVKKVKLRKLRSALRKTAPGSDTVRDLAARWGFYHIGNLARDYRSEFGELPSATLKKTGSKT